MTPPALSAASVERLPAAAAAAPDQVARPRFEALDSLRGVAALGVAYGHFWGPLFFVDSLQFSFYLLVDLFFVISGFVLAHRYLDDWLARRVTLVEVAGHRFARLYPLHLYGLLGMLLFFLLRSALNASAGLPFLDALQSGFEPYPDGRVYTFVLHLLLAHNIGLTPSSLSWLQASWSISLEFFCPLLLLIWIGFWRGGTDGRRGLSFVAPTAVLAVACALTVVNGAQSLNVSYQNLNAWLNYGALRCLAELAAGFLVYRTYRALSARLDISPAAATAAEIALFAAVSALLFRHAFTSPQDALIIPLFAALVFVLATARGWIARSLLLPPFRWAGKLSYSIYINHFLVVTWLTLVTYKPGWLYWGIVAAASWLTYRYIEDPARRAINARLARIT